MYTQHNKSYILLYNIICTYVYTTQQVLYIIYYIILFVRMYTQHNKSYILLYNIICTYVYTTQQVLYIII